MKWFRLYCANLPKNTAYKKCVKNRIGNSFCNNLIQSIQNSFQKKLISFTIIPTYTYLITGLKLKSNLVTVTNLAGAAWSSQLGRGAADPRGVWWGPNLKAVSSWAAALGVSPALFTIIIRL